MFLPDTLVRATLFNSECTIMPRNRVGYFAALLVAPIGAPHSGQSADVVPYRT